MANLGELRATLTEPTELLMQADGFCLWMAWEGECSAVLEQTIQDYGGVPAGGTGTQSLWFFFGTDVFLAAARLAVWARFNALSVAIQIFPAQFQVGQADEKTFVLESDSLWAQDLFPGEHLSIWVHGDCSTTVAGLLGVSLKKEAIPSGMADGEWFALEADSRLPYRPSLGWYAVLRPVGSPLDKSFQSGWREFFNHIEAVLQRNKFRFTLHDFFLMFPLDGLQEAKNWCRDFLSMVARVKVEYPEQYWPCVMVIVDKNNLNFNEELPKKIDVNWNQLSPDFPHMTLQTAMMLGPDFTCYEVRFAAKNNGPADWTGVGLAATSEEEGDLSLLPQLMPGSIALGEHPYCFYCGQRGHALQDCPTKRIPKRDAYVWRRIGTLDFASMESAVKEIDARLFSEEGESGEELLLEESPAGFLLQGYYDLIWPAQVRSITLFWRMRSKEMTKALSSLATEDNSPIWEILQSFADGEPLDYDKELVSLGHRFPKDFRVMSLQGFVALERGDFEKALSYWKDAEMFSTFPVIQAWHIFLQGRLYEYQGDFLKAESLYDSCMLICPSWHILDHRKLVCEIKRGFTGKILGALVALVEKDGNYFNRILLDFEMERGHIQVFATLRELWLAMEGRARDEEQALQRILQDLSNWFMPGNTFAEEVAGRINQLLRLTAYHNYVAFQSLANGRIALERDIQSHIRHEGRFFKSHFTSFIDRLQQIREEAAWFPFPSIMAEFNKSYNASVATLNWALKANFQVSESFKKAQLLMGQETERIKRLESRMRFLRIIRDSTLFVLSVFETFFWIEAVGLILVFVIVPLALFYGDKVGLDIASSLISKERWQVQKALFFVITVLALGSAGLRTVLNFERIRTKIFAKAKAKSIQLQEESTRKKSR